MIEPTVAVLPIDAIKVVEGFNARREFDGGALSELARSIEARGGVIQPLAVARGRTASTT